MSLSKSKYCNAIQCKKMLWLDINKPEMKEDVANQGVLDNGTEVGIVAKDLFGSHIDIEFNENLSLMLEDTKKALKNKEVVITEASFVYKNNFCSVDILKKKGNILEIYEVKSSTYLKDIYIDDISYQVYVLLSLGYKIGKAAIVHINSNYIRKGQLNLNKLFTIEDVTDIVVENKTKVEKNIEEINTYLKQKKEPKEDIGMQCKNPYECPFFGYCTRNLPENNVFKINGMRKSTMFNLYHKNIYTYEDLLKADIDLKAKQQIEFELLNKEDYINIPKIKSFLDTLSFPLYFLDFETFQQLVPEYDGVKPFMKIPFQYSLHYIETEDGKLEHKEFLAPSGEDPRRFLALQLVKDIPVDVCVLAYNMSFEKSVIKDLANLYPDLKEHLMNIYSNIKDLMIPFKNRDYYNKDMHGSYSIKYVLPALFPDDASLNYHNLDLIHNGSEAMSSFANLAKLEKNEQSKIRTNLLKYCELDTYAMVKIWEKLREVCYVTNR